MANIKHSYAVYNSVGQFFARFTSHARALRWVQREGMEWSAIIRKEKGKHEMKKKQKKSIDDYKPIIRENEGMVFETYGEDLEFVKTQDQKRIWTVVDGDGENPVVTAGYHYVNRIHYIITIKPWEDEFLELPYID